MISNVRRLKVLNSEEEKEFYSAIEENHPFVYHLKEPVLDHSDIEKMNYDIKNQIDKLKNEESHLISLKDRISNGEDVKDDDIQLTDENVELDSPFKVWSVETLTKLDTPGVKCLMIIETNPKEYDVFVYVNKGNYHNIFKYSVLSESVIESKIKSLLSYLKHHQMGVEKTKLKIKIGTGADKKHHVIKQIVHIGPKNNLSTYSETGNKIDWTHRFEVRGHWRKTSGIGKDRSGVYCIQNYTWVKEHTRGDERLPLIKKTRLVETVP